MYDWVYNNKRVIQVILFLIMLPFAFFGIDSYFKFSDESGYVATIGDSKISQQEFGNALRQRQEAIQKMLGNQRVDQAMLDNPEVRFSVVEEIVRQRLLVGQAVRSGLVVTDEDLAQIISKYPAFQLDGKFSLNRYQQLLKAQNLTTTAFETQLRRDGIVQQLAASVTDTGFVASLSAERLVRLSEQTREVSTFTVKPEQFLGQVKVDDAAAKAHYDRNQQDYRIPEQARVEYVVLSADQISPRIKLDPDEVRKTYESGGSRQYQRPEQRQASHILIRVEPGAPDAAKAKARELAESLAKQARENPKQFADLAKKHSQDPGSAAQGGDLGAFARGTMVKAFEDAAFGMKVGDVSGPVESEFGFHVIRLTGITEASGIPFAEARGAIEADLRRQRANREFAALADQFNNTVYEQSDSLKPVTEGLKLGDGEVLKLAVQTSDWIAKGSGGPGPLGNPKLLGAIFSDDVLKNKRNTEAVEIAPGMLVSARVVESKPAAMRPFDEVKGEIIKRLQLEQGGQLAIKDGKDKLEQLRKGADAGLAWSASQTVSRQQQGVPEPVLRQVFRLSAEKLPAFAGVEDGRGGYTLVRVTKVNEPETVTAERRQQVAQQLRQLAAQEQFHAYVSTLKLRADVKVKPEAIEKKDR